MRHESLKDRFNLQIRRWIIVVVFAAAMAWVEAAVVFYLRTMIDRIEPYQPNPFPVIGNFAPTELVREAATLVMLLTVGWLAGRTWRDRLGYAGVAFGVWDLLYYVFLKEMCGWPHSLLDWDVLFLLPLPWWGPVLAPVSIAILMIVWGTLASQPRHQRLDFRNAWGVWLLNLIGTLLALFLFMADTLRVARQAVEAIQAGAKARVEVPSTGKWFDVRNIVVVPSADPRTHTTRIRLELPEDVRGVYPGVYARAHFITGSALRLMVPRRAVVHRSEVTGVYVVDDEGVPRLRQVRLGEASDENNVEVLAGLRPGERVALDPVRAGMADTGHERP